MLNWTGRGLLRVLIVLMVLATLRFSAGSVTAIQGAVVGAPGHRSAGAAAQKGPFAVVLVVDAARADELNLAHMPNLARLVAGGTSYSQAWVGQLPSITETSHATIGTGVLPARHLVLGDTWRIPGTSQMSPDLLNAELTRTGYIGKFIHQKSVPSIASLIHGGYRGSLVVTLSGHKVYAADALGAGTADYVSFGMKNSSGHYVPGAIPGHAAATTILDSKQLNLPVYPRNGIEDEWTTTLTEKFLFKYHPRVMMVNLPEVDDYGHIAGTDATVMSPLMTNVDHEIGRLVAAYGRAGMLSQTYFIITADHGMVPAVHTVDQTSLRAIIQKAGGTPLYIGHGDYCPIWIKNTASIPAVAAALANANVAGVQSVYMRNATGAYSLVSAPSRLPTPDVNTANLDLLSTFASGEAPDIVLLYAENTITMTPSFAKIGRKGDHGGATWGAQHIPLVITGSNVRQAYVSDYPARLVDLAPTLETLLNIRPQGQDGVPLADAMTHPPAWAVQEQARVEQRMRAEVGALEKSAALQAQSSPSR